MSRPYRKPGAVRSHPSPLLAVELSTQVAAGPLKDKRHVALVAKPKKARRAQKTGLLKAKAGFPSVAELEAAATTVSRGVRAESVAGLLDALAHPQRVQILVKLLGGEATHRSLSKATGLKAGPLYHHLRELRMAGLIGPKVRDLYVLTARGDRAILAALAMERLCR